MDSAAKASLPFVSTVASGSNSRSGSVHSPAQPGGTSSSRVAGWVRVIGATSPHSRASVKRGNAGVAEAYFLGSAPLAGAVSAGAAACGGGSG